MGKQLFVFERFPKVKLPRGNFYGDVKETKELTQDRNHLDSKFKNIAGCLYVYEIQKHLKTTTSFLYISVHEFFPYDAVGTIQFVNPYF